MDPRAQGGVGTLAMAHAVAQAPADPGTATPAPQLPPLPDRTVMRRQILNAKARGISREDVMAEADRMEARARQLAKDAKWARTQINAIYGGRD